MNILAVMPTYRSSHYSGKVGGGEISNRILLEGLANRGHSVTVCTLDPGPDQETYRNGVKVIGSRVPDNESTIGKIIRIKRYKKFIEQAIRSSEIDIVLTGTYGINSSLLVAKKYNIPVAAFVRAFENFESFKNTNNIFRFIVRILVYGDFGVGSLRKLDYLFPNSKFMADICGKHTSTSKVKVIYPALHIDNVREVKRSPQPRNIFMIGSSDHKGFPIFKDLASDFPELSFHVVGDPTLNPGSEYRRGNLTFHGWGNVVEILSNEADLLLVPSTWREPFGRVAVEGLISGTPTLVSDIGGLPEAVNFEKKLLVKPSKKGAWRKAIFDFITSPDEVFIATQRAQNNVKNFSAERQVSELETFIQDSLR